MFISNDEPTGKKMVSYSNKGLWIKNTKTGSIGTIISQYVNTSNGKPMIQVAVFGIESKKAFWLASSVVEHAA